MPAERGDTGGADWPGAFRPDWRAPAGVRALMSTRRGGAGAPPFDSLNLALDPLDPAVEENRRRFVRALGVQPRWLHQVHGADVVLLGKPSGGVLRADASVSLDPAVACAVIVADCLPVLLCTEDGRAVAAAHAGWRGLAGGILERTVQRLVQASATSPDRLLAWLGPCIGPRQFEVGADVLEAFGVDPRVADDANWRRRDRPDGSMRWLADLPGLARQRLMDAGVARVSGGRWCTVEEPSRFFSFRRDRRLGPTGRMAAAIAPGG